MAAPNRIGRRVDRRQRPGGVGLRTHDRGREVRRDHPDGRSRSEALGCHRRTHREHGPKPSGLRVSSHRRDPTPACPPAARLHGGLGASPLRGGERVHLARLFRGRRARPGRRGGRAPGGQHVQRGRRHGRLLGGIVPAPERVRTHPVHPRRRARDVVHTCRAAAQGEQGPARRRRPARRVPRCRRRGVRRRRPRRHPRGLHGVGDVAGGRRAALVGHRSDPRPARGRIAHVRAPTRHPRPSCPGRRRRRGRCRVGGPHQRSGVRGAGTSRRGVR